LHGRNLLQRGGIKLFVEKREITNCKTQEPRCEPPVSFVFLATPFEFVFPFAPFINPGFAGCFTPGLLPFLFLLLLLRRDIFLIFYLVKLQKSWQLTDDSLQRFYLFY
jgi:hypothetical protein